MSSNSEIIARNMATLKRLTQAREERDMAKRAAAEINRKKAWQLSELARIERGPTSDEALGLGGGYGGYLDGYRGKRS
jgi:hypothetical protein